MQEVEEDPRHPLQPSTTTLKGCNGISEGRAILTGDEGLDLLLLLLNSLIKGFSEVPHLYLVKGVRTMRCRRGL